MLITASTGSFLAGPNMSAYYASKFAVLGFAEGYLRELRGTGVSLHLLCPGPVKTDLFRGKRRIAWPNEVPGQPLSDSIDHGMEPKRVAEIALAGLVRGVRHIFTHPETKPQLETHFGRVLDAFD